MNHLVKDPIQWLQSEYNVRFVKNQRYSLRAFARLVGLPSGRLSELFSGKRRMTLQCFEQVALRLGLSEKERQVYSAQLKSPKVSKDSLKKVRYDFLELGEDTFSQISDWYYLAILNLICLKNQSHVPSEIGKSLGLSVVLVKNALLTLERLGLIEKKSERFIRTSKPLTTSKDRPSKSIRQFHAQLLEKSNDALFNVPTNKREFSASIVRVNKNTAEKIRILLEKARRQAGELANTQDSTQVYAIALQFFPLSQEPANEIQK